MIVNKIYFNLIHLYISLCKSAVATDPHKNTHSQQFFGFDQFIGVRHTHIYDSKREKIWLMKIVFLRVIVVRKVVAIFNICKMFTYQPVCIEMDFL